MKKLLLITFRQSLEEALRHLLHEIGVKNYTLISGVLGEGITGKITGTFSGQGLNSVLLVVIDEEEEKPVLERLKAFHKSLATHEYFSKIPLRLFVLPCDQII